MTVWRATQPAFTLVRQRLFTRPALVLAGLILLAAWLATMAGAVSVTLDDVLAITRDDGEPLSGSAYILWHLRVPRILFSLLIGAALALSGALTQGLFRNPLADPGLLGVTSGAACAAALTIVVFASSGIEVPQAWRYWILPVTAFSGAIAVCFILDNVARWLTADSIGGLLLTGIALNALAASVIGLCTYLATDEQLRTLSFWTLGSLSGANWILVAILLGLLIAALWYLKRLTHLMNALALGEAAAAHIGVNVRQIRVRVFVLVAILSGFAVAWCGMIGFIGLVAPHIIRLLIGPDQRQLAPLAMLMGGLLLLLADTAARTMAIPAEIPVGIFTALLGAPFFMVLLSKVRGG